MDALCLKMRQEYLEDLMEAVGGIIVTSGQPGPEDKMAIERLQLERIHREALCGQFHMAIGGA